MASTAIEELISRNLLTYPMTTELETELNEACQQSLKFPIYNHAFHGSWAEPKTLANQ